MDDIQEELLRQVIQVGKDVAAARADIAQIRDHVFNGLTSRVEEIHDAVRAHPSECPFLAYQRDSPEHSPAGQDLRRRKTDNRRRLWRVVAYIVAGLAGASATVGGIYNIVALIGGGP